MCRARHIVLLAVVSFSSETNLDFTRPLSPKRHKNSVSEHAPLPFFAREGAAGAPVADGSGGVLLFHSYNFRHASGACAPTTRVCSPGPTLF